MANEIQAIEKMIRQQTEQQQLFINSVSQMMTNNNSKFQIVENNLSEVQKDIKDIKENEELENDKYNRLNKLKASKVEETVANTNEVIKQELYRQITRAIKEKFNLSSLPKIKKKDEQECESFIENFKFNINNASISACRKFIKEFDKIIGTDSVQRAKYIIYDYEKCLNMMDKSYKEEFENHYKYTELKAFLNN
ncbi:ORF6C domain-containing protein [Peptostreptococcus equinus]|uniref:ORF6C domain-containing protein n=1 Tax=Peptostreptococcus equinus TaxID=3003601 RepID=A0ABY7JMP1_9FIRM|nr:ORF6C domain-containing protein [Peptostreptococcus sp. CBA3647]WAW14638.1 ORF6C domain-containing protein [Peptostreptococcus sp. CBA3647]